VSILVTGASGFLGSAVVESLCARQVPHVRCFLRPRSDRSNLDRLQREYPQCKIEYLIGNLASAADCRLALEGITVVLHLAAQMKGAPATLFLNTVIASKRLLEAMLEARPKRVVLVSSLAVYGPTNAARLVMLDEAAPVERSPEKRDVYSQTKLWQESLFRSFEMESGCELVVLRPGVIYGEGGQEFSPRVGLQVGNWLWRFGRNSNVLPLTYVKNCAEAVAMAGLSADVAGCYNVVDDDLPTVAEYLHQYNQEVRNVRSIRVPWWLTRLLSKAVESYSIFSKGQLPPVLTSYKSRVLWRDTRFNNCKLKNIGWRQTVPTADALARTFEYFRGRTNPAIRRPSLIREPQIGILETEGQYECRPAQP
jgi:nucleoside-diphosphate-sugar epimerase